MVQKDWDFDIFISYAHLDNQSLFRGQPGWITQFHDMLEVRLGEVLGKSPRIWRDDERLQGNVVFDDEIEEQLQRAATIICILSPRYILSDYCKKELRYFLETAGRSGNLKIGNKSRIFKVVKTHIKLDQHPPEIKNMLGYYFYEREKPEIEYRVDLEDPPIRKAYFEVLNELVFHVKQLIENLEAFDSPESAPSHDPNQKTVYLAETTSDLQDERNRIKREIERSGHLVQPDSNLSIQNPEIEKEIESYLDRCDLSIHMLGAHYGVIPENASISLNEIQLEAAARKAKEKGLFPIIWVPSDLENSSVHEKQQRFLDRVKLDASILERAELLQTNLTELKSFVDRKLSSLQQEESPDESVVPNQIYLICDREDTQNVKLLDDYLFNQGFDVIRSPLEGDQLEIRKAHQYFMTVCEAVLIYHGRANTLWLNQKLQYLRKINGYGRERPLLAKAVYIAPPVTEDKKLFRTNLDIEIIRENGGFSPTLLQPFVDQLKRDQ